MKQPSLDHLFWLRHDAVKFEVARQQLISDYIKSLPEKHRKSAYAMQCKIDLARQTLSQDEFLQWMKTEFVELSENLSDQFAFIAHKAQELKSTLDKLNESPPQI
jgi:hypothetical protein